MNVSILILSDAQNANAVQVHQDPGFQGNKGESVRDEGPQTNDGGKGPMQNSIKIAL